LGKGETIFSSRSAFKELCREDTAIVSVLLLGSIRTPKVFPLGKIKVLPLLVSMLLLKIPPQSIKYWATATVVWIEAIISLNTFALEVDNGSTPVGLVVVDGDKNDVFRE